MKGVSPRHTMRGRLLLLAIGVEMLMLTVLLANSLRLLRDAMTNQARWQAEQMAPALNAALTAPLAQRDFATVQAVINESRSAGGADYIAVVDSTGRRVAGSGWKNDLPLPEPNKSFSLFDKSDAPRHDVAIPISQYGQVLGTLHFGLNLSQIVAARRVLLTQGVGIACIELVLSALILVLIVSKDSPPDPTCSTSSSWTSRCRKWTDTRQHALSGEKASPMSPFIALTAHAMKGEQEKCPASGMNDYITKPIKREVVFEKIREWIFDKRTAGGQPADAAPVTS